MWNKRKKKRLAVMGAVVVFVCVFAAGCKDNRQKEGEEKQEGIKIPMILTVDPSSGKKVEKE